MAKVFFKPDNVTHEIEDGTQLMEACEELAATLPFGCTEGTCGVCELTVLDGMKNCSRPSEEERDYLFPEDFEAGMRLGCQMRIKKGDVSLTWKALRSK